MADHSNTSDSIAFVADKEWPQLPAPVSTTGPIAWVTKNFFSSVLDTILTLFCLYLLYVALSHLLPWLIFDSVWIASSLSECRELGTGACFAVVVDRFDQLVLGFYPADAYWRPILAFFLMLVAFAPIMHDSLPRKMLWFSAGFPLVAYWLLWGDSLWGPLLIIGMIVLCVIVYNILASAIGSTVALIATVALAVVWLFFIQGPLSSTLSNIVNLFGLKPVESAKFGGFLITFVIGVTGIVGSLPIGIVLALGRGSNMPTVKMICVGFIEFIRGVPLITLLFVASSLLNYFLPPGTEFDLILRVLIMVTLFASAYMAEVIRGGLAALPRGQYEAADALGLNYWQATRLIILPQALKISIPGIVNTFIGLFKDTTLVSIVGIFDPIGIMNPIRSTAEWNGIIWEMPLFIGFVFFLCCITMSRYSMYFERKLDTGHKK